MERNLRPRWEMAGEKELGIAWSRPFWRDLGFLCYTPLQAFRLKEEQIGIGKIKSKGSGKTLLVACGGCGCCLILCVNDDVRCDILADGVWCDSLPGCGSLYPRRFEIGLVILCLLANWVACRVILCVVCWWCCWRIRLLLCYLPGLVTKAVANPSHLRRYVVGPFLGHTWRGRQVLLLLLRSRLISLLLRWRGLGRWTVEWDRCWIERCVLLHGCVI